jgi:EAL domain-containing protein (putative c-di-GMP-specific phosphodiesterase class I)
MRAGIAPTQIQLEITESLLMSQPERAKETLESCRKMGLKIAIDDFGTGYSSLSYLHSYPIGTLKIDQAFVRDMLNNPNSMELSKSIIALGKNLNMTIIAEGGRRIDRGDNAAFARAAKTLKAIISLSLCREKDILALLTAQPSFSAKLA